MYKWTDGTDYLAHHGIKGQKWGVRNYQNPDGSYTAEGLARYGRFDGKKKAANVLKDISKHGSVLVTVLKKYNKKVDAKDSGKLLDAAMRIDKKNTNDVYSGFDYAKQHGLEYMVPGYTASYLSSNLSEEELEQLKALMIYSLDEVGLYDEVNGKKGSEYREYLKERMAIADRNTAMLTEFVKQHDRRAKKENLKKIQKTNKVDIN